MPPSYQNPIKMRAGLAAATLHTAFPPCYFPVYAVDYGQHSSRPMNLKVGIVGLPNVGKSTLFSALTKTKIDIANYPFTTIDPNVGVVSVADPRLEQLSALSHSAKTISAVVEFVDIAGLVKGAAAGEGLGNKFLSHIREVDAICEVVRGFSDPSIIHTLSNPDPQRDIEVINTELVLKDLETIGRALEKAKSDLKAGAAKEQLFKIATLEKAQKALNDGVLASTVGFSAEESEVLQPLTLLTHKPFLYVLNVAHESEQITLPGIDFIYLNIRNELDASDLSLAEQEELGVAAHVDELITRAYQSLGLITFFTTGEDETRAWTIVRGSTAPVAGSAIHSDFQEQFIKAMVVPWDKLLAAGGWPQAAKNGWVQTCGKDYIVADGDVIEFKI